MTSKNILLPECLPYIIFQNIIGTAKLESRKMKMFFSHTPSQALYQHAMAATTRNTTDRLA